MSVCGASHLGDAQQIFANVVYNQQGPQIHGICAALSGLYRWKIACAPFL